MSADRFRPEQAKRKRAGAIFQAVCLVSIGFSIAVLAILIVDVARDGMRWLSWDFLSRYPSRIPARAGIKSAILGSLLFCSMNSRKCEYKFPGGNGDFCLHFHRSIMIREGFYLAVLA